MYVVAKATLAKQPTLVIRDAVAVHDLSDWLGQAFGEVEALLRASGAKASGQAFGRYQPLGDDRFEVEAGLPVEVAVPGAGRVESASLPDGPAVTTVHVGSYDTIRAAYDALAAWVAGHGAAPSGTPWETYETPPEGDAPPRTTVVMPYYLRP